MVARFVAEAQKISKLYSSIYGSPPLLSHEDRWAHDKLGEQIHLALTPKDGCEKTLVRDIQNCSWYVVYYTRARAGARSIWISEELRHAVIPLFKVEEKLEDGTVDVWLDSETLDRFIDEWRFGDDEAIEYAERNLGELKLTMEMVEHRAVMQHMHELEQYDRRIADAEKRRNAALRELQRYRSCNLKELRSKVIAIEEAAGPRSQGPVDQNPQGNGDDGMQAPLQPVQRTGVERAEDEGWVAKSIPEQPQVRPDNPDRNLADLAEADREAGENNGRSQL
jgi:hypothetical protein